MAKLEVRVEWPFSGHDVVNKVVKYKVNDNFLAAALP